MYTGSTQLAITATGLSCIIMSTQLNRRRMHFSKQAAAKLCALTKNLHDGQIFPAQYALSIQKTTEDLNIELANTFFEEANQLIDLRQALFSLTKEIKSTVEHLDEQSLKKDIASKASLASAPSNLNLKLKLELEFNALNKLIDELDLLRITRSIPSLLSHLKAINSASARTEIHSITKAVIQEILQNKLPEILANITTNSNSQA